MGRVVVRHRGCAMDAKSASNSFANGVLYESRAEAGRRLGLQLEEEGLRDVVVLALARAGVEVAAEVARILHAPLQVICVNKILHPIERSIVLGAVTADGGVCLRERGGLTDPELTMAADEARAEALLLDHRLRGARLRVALVARTVVVVDDGLETGASMTAALHSVRARGAERVIAAVPVATVEGLATLEDEADKVVCSISVQKISAVSTHYRIYPQVSEEEIAVLLRTFGPVQSA